MMYLNVSYNRVSSLVCTIVLLARLLALCSRLWPFWRFGDGFDAVWFQNLCVLVTSQCDLATARLGC